MNYRDLHKTAQLFTPGSSCKEESPQISVADRSSTVVIRLRFLPDRIKQLIWALVLAAAFAAAGAGESDAFNTGCVGGTCPDVPSDGIRYTSGVNTVNVGDGVPGATVVQPGMIGIELTRTGVYGGNAADAAFQTVLWDTDNNPDTPNVDVVSRDGSAPYLIGSDYIFVQTYDGNGDPDTFRIGTDIYSGIELFQYLSANSSDTGATISGSLTVNNNAGALGEGAPFTTTNAGGIVASSTGGRGGDGGIFTIILWTWGSKGSNGGDAGSVVVNSNSTITVNSESKEKHGITAVSQGGDGGDGGGWFGLIGSTPGGGGDGGDGSPVFVTLGPDSIITTHGEKSYGVYAQSRGGNGGRGGNASGAIALGSNGGNGGDAGDVLVDNDGSIRTTGSNSHGIYARSVGAGAGSGSSSDGIYAEGGNGGGESSGAMVTVNNSGTIITEQADSFGILAQSIGGGGGDGGDAGGWFTVGGRAGSGGGSDVVTVFDSGTVQTSGDRSTAIFAQSIGGGGGNGGDAVSIAPSLSIAVGGNGGLGGKGDDVYVISEGSDIDTSGNNAHGINAQSIGGGGGNGGMAVSGTMGSSPIDLSIALGGKGNGGGDAGDLVSVQTSSETMINTTGIRSYGIIAQSIGGGGGSGGTALSQSGGPGLKISVSIGGSAANGGAGKDVDIDNAGTITTSGDLSAGIFTQSIGGGGGNGGFAGSLAIGGSSASVSLGGSGGLGGAAGKIDVDNIGTIRTGGHSSAGIFAQSIGGGGGNGGSALSGSIGLASVSTAVGGSGGAGNNGGLVDILNSGLITTLGNSSAGIFAQSVGGGGGSGGDATSLALAGPVAVAVAVGGGGGSGGIGGKVVVDNEGIIRTGGPNSDGIFAQSVGGGGGSGGSATTGTLVFPIEIEGVEIPAISANVSVGGRGGGGGTTGIVMVTNSGEIDTADFLSNGIFAQSVGGSGGRGGHATNISIAYDAMFTGKVSVGGSGGKGGTGNTVDVENFGLIHTKGDFSNGVFAQSVGGGGGVGGNSTNVSLSLTPPPTAPEDFIPTPSMDFDLAIGGDGGSGATGGYVQVKNYRSIVTEGKFAAGVMAQSVGGAGGTGGDARTIQVELTADPMDFLPLTALAGLDLTFVFGGSGGTGSHGGGVFVENEGDMTTTGAFSHGIVAQSVGGGGGSGGSAMTFEFSNADAVPEIPVIDEISGLTTIEMTLQGSGGGGGDGGNVTVNSTGTVRTSGAFAMGIVAQSVAGGGGLAGFFNPHGITNNVIADTLINTFVDTEAGFSFAGSVGGAGTAGDVTVRHTGDILTLGDGAHGIFAQSAAGSGAGGTVTVTIDGNITANGLDADGILGQSAGHGGADTITVNVNGVVRGGSGSGAGVAFLDGTNNILTNRGTISALSTVAIRGGKGNETIDNYGTVTGNVDLGSGSNAFNNKAGGLFNAGGSVVLGAGNVLHNAGTFSPGGDGAVLTTTLSSDYVQTSGGTFAVDIDFRENVSDRLNLGGTADLAGTAGVSLANAGWIVPGAHQVTVISAAGGVTNPGLGLDVAQSAVAGYRLLYPNPTDVAIEYSIDFSPSGLNQNQKEIGDYIAAVQSAGGSEGFAPIVSALFGLTDVGDLGSAYDHLSPEPYIAVGRASLFSNLQFHDALQSCRVVAGQYRFVSEGQCTWMRITGQGRRHDRTSEHFGVDHLAVGISGGLQAEINKNLHLGIGLSYERIDLEADNLASSTGDQLQAGAVLKGRFGATMVSAAISGGYGWYETDRYVNLPVEGTIARSDYGIGFASGHLRVSHDFEQHEWYLRPMVDAGVTYINIGSFRERGAGAANLDVRSTDKTYLSIHPALEIGGEVVKSRDALYRPFAKVGFTHFLSGTDSTISAAMEGAPGGTGPFSVNSKMDRTLADVSVGLDIIEKSSVNLRFGYTGQFSSRTEHHSLSLKLVLPF